MEVRLIVLTGKHRGQELPVSGPKFFIGRAEDCHLRPGSDLVSRHHAVILVEEGFVAIRDFASKNGTFVNGERIRSERELKMGDRLKIGPLEFEVQLAVEIGGKKKPKVDSIQEAAARTVQSAEDDDEMDISDWLDDDQQSQDTTKVHHSRPPETIPTAGSSIKDTIVMQQDETGQKPEEKKKEDKKKTFGRLPQNKQPTAANTQSAADDMLRQFFSRKS